MNSNLSIHWRWLRFEDCSGAEVHQILRARQQVFIVEQKCIYNDIDEYDTQSYHLLGTISENPSEMELAAYLRVLFPGTKYAEPSIGRVLTVKKYRRLGFAELAISEAIAKCYHEFSASSIRVAAQSYLEGLYEKFGFLPFGELYDEDGIEHRDMLLERK